jgi:tetratricopeptide (TPR) repeat protein
MKKIFVFGILILILGGFLFAQQKDTTQSTKEVEKYQAQIDSLKTEVEKVKKDAYEKAIHGANRSVAFSTLVVGIVGLLAALLGVLGYFRIREARAETEKEIKKARDEIDRELSQAKAEMDKELEEAHKCVEKIKGKGVEADELLEILRSKTEIQKEFQPIDFTKEVAELTQKDASEAVQMYEQFSDRIFGEDIYWAMAYNYYQLGEFEKSANEFEKYVKTNPEDFVAYFNWATALTKLADLKKDESLYQECFEKYALAVKYKEDYHEAYSSWGIALLELGKLKKERQYFKEALEKIERAIEIKKDNAFPWYDKACAHSLLKEKEKALESLKRAIELDAKYKKMAKEDEDFKWLWDDKDFKKLVE